MELIIALGQLDMVLLPPLILWDTVRDVVDLTTLPQQQPQSKVPSQANVKFTVGPCQLSFLFRVECPTDFLLLVFFTVFAFCSLTLMWLQFSTMRAH